MDDTLNLIQQYANERHNLYRQAAKKHLSYIESSRLHELDGQLSVLWDRYRRELASRSTAASSASRPGRAA